MLTKANFDALYDEVTNPELFEHPQIQLEVQMSDILNNYPTTYTHHQHPMVYW